MHIDSPHHRADIRERLFEQARDRGTLIIDLGDLFDAMQGTGDRRSKKGDLLPGLNVPTYLDELVMYAADRLEPVAQNLAVLGKGNHEESVKDHKEVDLTQRLALELERRTGCRPIVGNYGGYILVRIIANKSWRGLYRIFYTHGWGGRGLGGVGAYS